MRGIYRSLFPRGYPIWGSQYLRTAAVRATTNEQCGGDMGGLQVLKHVPGDKLAIMSNSEYLIFGAQGQVHLWNEMAWIGKGA